MKCLFFFFLFIFRHIQSEPFIWQADLSPPFHFSLQLPQEPIMQYAPFEIELHIRFPSTYEIDLSSLLYALSNSVNPFDPLLKIDLFASQTFVEKDTQIHHVRFIARPLKTEKIYFSFSRINFTSKKNDVAPFSILTPLLSLTVFPFVEASPPLIAPLLWLEPQFPIGLTKKNQQPLQSDQEKEKQINQLLSQHTFPWLNLLFLLFIGGVGYTLYITKSLWKKRGISSIQKPLPSRELLLQTLQYLRNIHSRDKKFYISFSTLCIQALEYRIGKPLRGLTSKELLLALSDGNHLSDFQRGIIFSFLQQVELGKFGLEAFFNPISEDLLVSIQRIIQECLYHTSNP